MWKEGFDYVEVNHSFDTPLGKRFTKWKRMRGDEVAQYVQDNSGKGRDFFRTIQAFSTPDKRGKEPHYAPLFFDLDSDDGARSSHQDAQKLVRFFIEGYDVEPEVWFSGNKGFHILVPGVCFGSVPDRQLTYHWRHVAELVADRTQVKTLDKRVYSVPRMWRVEGTRHPKSGMYKTRLSVQDLLGELQRIKEIAQVSNGIQASDILWKFQGREDETDDRLAEIYSTAKAEFEERQKIVSTEGAPEYQFDNQDPACIQRLLSEGLIELGTKNRADMALAGYFKSSGYDINQAKATIAEWARGIPDTLTHVHDPEQRIAQSQYVLSVVYREEKYHFSCGSILACGLDESICKDCHVKERPALEVSIQEYARADFMGKKIDMKWEI